MMMKLPYMNYGKLILQKKMLKDTIRTEGFKNAIFDVVKEGDIVLDFGSGTGILSFFALQAGAEIVYSVERTEIINHAKRIARWNNFDGNIIFINDDINNITTIEPLDVLISECIGYFVLEENMIESFIKCRKKFLKSDGNTIPNEIFMYISLFDSINSKKDYNFNDEINYWNNKLYGIKFSGMDHYAANNTYKEMVLLKDLITSPTLIKHISLKSDDEVSLDVDTTQICEKDGIISGLVGFFSLKLSNNVLLSTTPNDPRTHWENTIFPIYKPLTVHAGDKIRIKIRSKIDNIDHEMVDWEWYIKNINTNHSRHHRTDYHSLKV